MPTGQRRYSDEEREEVVRRVKAGKTMYAVAVATGIRYSTVESWVKSVGKKRRHSSAVKEEAAVRAPGFGSAGGREGGDDGKSGARRGMGVAIRKSAGGSGKSGTAGRSPEGISWALEGEVLVLRIPLGRVARQMAALKVLAKIESELEHGPGVATRSAVR